MSKNKNSKSRSGHNPTMNELKLKSLLGRLVKENELLNGEVSATFEEMIKEINELRERIELLEKGLTQSVEGLPEGSKE